MIGRSVGGILAAQSLFLVAGLGVLWALRGWRTWAELLRLAGVAYVLGVAVVGVEATLVLVGGAGVPTSTVLALALGTAAATGGYASLRRRPFPRAGGFARLRTDAAGIAGLAALGITAALLAAFYRVARVNGMQAFDAFAFWIPKAKAIYFFGGLDETLFRTLPGPSYPLFVPALQAMDFHLMGSADQVTIALQYWFLLLGFVAAVAGLLRPRVPAVLVWTFLALAVALPELGKRMLNPQADWPLDIFFALAALCVAVWLTTGERWLLGVYALLLAAELATKREGQMLTACLLVPALAVTWRSARRAWPWLVGLAVAAYLVNVPWRIWWESRGLAPDTPDSGVGTLSAHASRIGPAIRIVLELLFDYGMWLAVVPIALAAALTLLARRDWQLPTLFAGTTLLALVGFTWILWSIPSLPLNTSQGATPIPRAVGAVVLLAVAYAPLLLWRLLGGYAWAPIFRSRRSTSPRSTLSVEAAGSERTLPM